MATPSAIPVDAPRETVKRIHRVTREKRNLWYVLTVLQQPERARACGSGMKGEILTPNLELNALYSSLTCNSSCRSANSDRRPVDPPPVVELRIYEGPSIEKGKLITFEYNANFFLYASLQSARSIAHGRVQNSALNNPPILTGVPASGMAYLDKPAEAGYFIFPDLSVRHEGTYRLSFSLFEMTKEEKDYDLEPDEELPNGVDWRMDIETLPFSVYSAKKFPGLMESTPLSRTVAEQGCRVRIRRDVRMRKRDTKAGNMDRHDGEYSRHRTVTPAPSDDSRAIRARSTSNSSEHRAPYPGEAQRRPSIADSYPPPTPLSAHDQASAAGRGHLTFDQSAPQYATPCPTAPHVPPMSPSGPYNSAQQSPYVKAEPHSYRHADIRSMGQTVKPEPYERRPSSGAYMPPSPSVYSSGPGSRRDSYMSHPITPITPAMPAQSHIRPHTSRSPMSITALVSQRPIEPQPPLEPREHTLPAPVQMFKAGDKRKRAEVFFENIAPLYNGCRQPDSGHSAHEDSDMGVYKRADGTSIAIPFRV